MLTPDRLRNPSRPFVAVHLQAPSRAYSDASRTCDRVAPTSLLGFASTTASSLLGTASTAASVVASAARLRGVASGPTRGDGGGVGRCGFGGAVCTKMTVPSTTLMCLVTFAFLSTPHRRGLLLKRGAPSSDSDPSSSGGGTMPCDQLSSSAHAIKWSISPPDATEHAVITAQNWASRFGLDSVADHGATWDSPPSGWQNKVGPMLLPKAMVTETVPTGWSRMVSV
mmetsp:Transcript_120702/g.341973  ORF Transcript_120702/g.341973 Transcript_120702/m.341973 type:complete len:226 (-) Transcript_120702:429-1106(-)